MARRYSASEKAKWTAKSTSPVRRAPVQIPRTDNSELIEQNKLTLIGRVSNPTAQNTHALARFRVHINGLRPLERHLDVSLPSGDILKVELEYEGLHKHCFSCQSLLHEQDGCPSRSSSQQGPMGINQSRTLEKLAERRRNNGRTSSRPTGVQRKDSAPHRITRSYQGPSDGPLRSFNPSRDRNHRDARCYVSSDHRRAYAPSPPKRSEERRKEVWIPRTELSDSTPKSDPRATGRLSVKTVRQLQISEVSHTPPPRPPREPMISAAGTQSILSTSRDRRSARERISPALSLNVSSERRPTVERLSLPIHRDSLPLNEDDRIRSDLRQVLENRCIEEQVGDTPLLLGTRTLGTQDPRPEASPIRTLSEDRLHVSMRIGPLPVEPDSFDDLGSLPKRSGRLAAKVLGKRKPTSQPPTKTGPSSPSQGISIKRRRVTKSQSSPKRKLV
ncbi:hypothetical protein IGI04_018557, partial [Brassica rapa subsp. trilocularis]